MRVLQIAYGIFTLSNVNGLVRHHLYILAVQQSLILLGYHFGYLGFSGIEIILQFFHSV